MRKSDDPNFKTMADLLNLERLTWEQMLFVFDNLKSFMATADYKAFNADYVKKKGHDWSDVDLENILGVFEQPNGHKRLGKVLSRHSSTITSDYANDIYNDLINGRLVIIDQSSGDEEENKEAAERITWRVFKGNQSKFRTGEKDLPEILIYVLDIGKKVMIRQPGRRSDPSPC